MARPGTLDYSKWDNLDVSSDEEPPPPAPPPIFTPPSKRPRADEPRDEFMGEMPWNDDFDIDDEESDFDHEEVTQLARRTGTCTNCGRQNVEKRCSRCQEAWFCDRACQAAAWPTHNVVCFAKSETAAWWGILGSSSQPGDRARDILAAQQQRLEFRRAVAATRERRRAAARAAALAAANRVNAKGGDAKGGKGVQDREETCVSCQCEFTVTGDSGEGICCPSSHFVCSECTGVFVQSIINDLEASFPPKCSMCRAELPAEAFERQLNPQQQKFYGEFVAQRSLAATETMLKCQCGYMEIRTDRPVLWWCSMCGRGECQVCNLELPRRSLSDLKAVMGASGEKGDSDLDMALRPHIDGCASLREAKRKVDEAFEKGQKMPCPDCGLAGRKDDACTHMDCPRCQSSWCYVCGLSVDKCDKAPARPGRPANDIFLHNTDWETNPSRCPMYLTQILEVDPAWLGDNWEDGDEIDDDRCLAYFHRWRTIKLLQDVQEEIGPATFEKVWLHFHSIRNAGYELEEIVHTDTSMLIDREGWLPYDEEAEEEDDEEEEDEEDEEEEEEVDDEDDELFGGEDPFHHELFEGEGQDQFHAEDEKDDESDELFEDEGPHQFQAEDEDDDEDGELFEGENRFYHELCEERGQFHEEDDEDYIMELAEQFEETGRYSPQRF